MPRERAFVIWAKEVKLSQFLAKSLDAQVVLSFKEKWLGVKIPVLFRYILQSVDTYKKLRYLQPDTVFVQNPPILAVLVVWLYTKMNKANYIIDTHTAGFLDRKWQAFHWLHKRLAKGAALNTVHNYKNQEILKSWGIENSYVLQFYNPDQQEIFDPKTKLSEKLQQVLQENSERTKIFMVNRFANDDAWPEVVKTAKLLKEAIFFITGNDQKLSAEQRAQMPSNVVLTGYLQHGEFILLMQESDVVLALTKRKDTVLWSLREIMALEKPFVTTDSEVLRHYYKNVGIFTNHEPLDMAKKIQSALENQAEFKQKINKFLQEDKIRWEKDIKFLKSFCR